jgi:4'-phosphopantetheinyl transferase
VPAPGSWNLHPIDHDTVSTSRASDLDSPFVQVWCARLDTDRDTLERARRNLSPEELDRAAQFKVDGARNTYVISHAVVRAILRRMLSCSPQAIRFEPGANGKPFLASWDGSPRPPLHFNLSHSGVLAVCGVSWTQELGIDVEKHRPMPDLGSIAANYFSKAECHALLSVPEGLREPAFFNCWTRKEAYVKAVGGGLSMPLDRFQVSLTPGEPAAFLNIGNDPEETQKWFLSAFSPAPGYSAAVALRQPKCTLRVFPVRPARDFLLDHQGVIEQSMIDQAL